MFRPVKALESFVLGLLGVVRSLIQIVLLGILAIVLLIVGVAYFSRGSASSPSSTLVSPPIDRPRPPAVTKPDDHAGEVHVKEHWRKKPTKNGRR